MEPRLFLEYKKKTTKVKTDKKRTNILFKRLIISLADIIKTYFVA